MLLGAWLPSFVYQRAGARDSVGILGAGVQQSVMQAHGVVLNVCTLLRARSQWLGYLTGLLHCSKLGCPLPSCVSGEFKILVPASS